MSATARRDNDRAPVTLHESELRRRWYTVAEVAQMLGYGETKVRMLVLTGDLRSLKDGGCRRILPAWIDEYVARRAAEAATDWP